MRYVLIIAAFLGIATATRAQAPGGKFDGTWQGEGKPSTVGYSGVGAAIDCTSMTMEIAVNGTAVQGSGTRNVIGGRTVGAQTLPITGSVDDDGTFKGQIFGRPSTPPQSVTGHFDGTQMVGSYTGPLCAYKFALTRR